MRRYILLRIVRLLPISNMMIILLLFLQKQNLACAVYLFGSVLSITRYTAHGISKLLACEVYFVLCSLCISACFLTRKALRASPQGAASGPGCSVAEVALATIPG